MNVLNELIGAVMLRTLKWLIPKSAKQRKRFTISIVLVIIICIDLALIYYNLTIATDEKKVEIATLPSDVLEVKFAVPDRVLVRTNDSILALEDGNTLEYFISGHPTDYIVGSMTGAVAILIGSNMISYYEPNNNSALFSIELNGSIDLLGISEKYAMGLYRPTQIGCIIRNDTSTCLMQISVSSGGAILWKYEFHEEIVEVSTAKNANGIAIALENNTVYYFRATDSKPRAILQFSERIKKLEVSPSCVYLAVLYGDESVHLAHIDLYRDYIVWTADLPLNSTSLFMHGEAESYILRSDDSLIFVNETIITPIISIPNIEEVAVPSVSDEFFVVTSDKIEKFQLGRATPIWRADTTLLNSTRLAVDTTGSSLVIWSRNHYALIDDSEATYGNSALTRAIGFLIIAEIVLIPVYHWRRKIVNFNRHHAFVLFLGALGGAIAYSVMEGLTAGEHSATSILLTILAAFIAASSSLVSWKSEGGLGGIIYGSVAGLLLSIPVSLCAQFITWSFEMDIPSFDSSFATIIYGFLMSVKIAPVGAVIGAIYNKVLTSV
ncbi:MAG: hypothetical protein QW087_03435 [Methanomassiliicoccales archaeon]